MPGLRDILDAATPGPWEAAEDEFGWALEGPRQHVIAETIHHEPSAADFRLAALAPELAALVLDMGEELSRDPFKRDGWQVKRVERIDALLARLDQLGKEQT